MKHWGEVVKGKFRPFDRLKFIQAFLKHEGQIVGVTVERKKQNRSLQQNKYMWLILGIISEETGHEPEELHAYFKQKFNYIHSESFNEMIPGSTTKLSTNEFTNYIEKIKVFAADRLGLYIPDANEI